MSVLASQLTKAQVGVAACAVAAAAVLTPVAVAKAAPELALPASPMSQIFGTDPIEAPMQLSTDVPWWWFGNSPNPNARSLVAVSTTAAAQPGNVILQFQPLSMLPGFIRPAFGWFQSLNLSVCVAGLGVQLSGYGTVTVRSGAC